MGPTSMLIIGNPMARSRYGIVSTEIGSDRAFVTTEMVVEAEVLAKMPQIVEWFQIDDEFNADRSEIILGECGHGCRTRQQAYRR